MCIWSEASVWHVGTKHWSHELISPGQNGHHFADDIFRCIFMNEKFCILIKISLELVPMGPNDKNPALVQTRAWLRIAISHHLKKCSLDSRTHICCTRGRWVNTCVTAVQHVQFVCLLVNHCYRINTFNHLEVQQNVEKLYYSEMSKFRLSVVFQFSCWTICILFSLSMTIVWLCWPYHL